MLLMADSATLFLGADPDLAAVIARIGPCTLRGDDGQEPYDALLRFCEPSPGSSCMARRPGKYSAASAFWVRRSALTDRRLRPGGFCPFPRKACGPVVFRETSSWP